MKYTKYILSIVIPFGLLYLVVSLFNWSLNWFKWNHASIVIYSVLGGIFTTYFIMHNLAMYLSCLNNIEVVEPETVAADGSNG